MATGQIKYYPFWGRRSNKFILGGKGKGEVILHGPFYFILATDKKRGNFVGKTITWAGRGDTELLCARRGKWGKFDIF